MPIQITMPRLSDTMEAGTILKWNVGPGDAVSSGDVVADVETDKATMELTSFDDGVVARILVPEGEQVDVGTVIAELAEDGESADEAEDSTPAASPTPTSEAAPAAATDAPAAPRPAAVASADGARVRVSPVARRLAEEHRIDLSAIQGSGPSGRIIKRDVLAAVETKGETASAVPPSAAQPSTRTAMAVRDAEEPSARRATVPATPVTAIQPVATEPVPGTSLEARRIPVSGMRQTIARRLVESKVTIPHYQVTVTFDMDPLLELRKQVNGQLGETGVKLSVNDFLVRACALAMHKHPEFNASWDEDAIIVHGAVNIGVAVSLPAERGGGLVVATIRSADQKSLRVISAETRQLAEKARTRGLSIEDMSDSTFTLSNLGMFGVEHFTAIINPPNSAILAVGAAIKKPVVRNDELVIGHEMSATLSSDHRVIDGAMAAQFLQTLKGLIEAPAGVLV